MLFFQLWTFDFRPAWPLFERAGILEGGQLYVFICKTIILG